MISLIKEDNKMKSALIAAILTAALVMLMPAVGWSQMGGSGGMMGGNSAGMTGSGSGMMGGSMMNRGQTANQNTMQNGTGLQGAVSNLMNDIGHLLGQGSEAGHGSMDNGTAMNGNAGRAQRVPKSRKHSGNSLQSTNR
jgi:hypothetical protein